MMIKNKKEEQYPENYCHLSGEITNLISVTLPWLQT